MVEESDAVVGLSIMEYSIPINSRKVSLDFRNICLIVLSYSTLIRRGARNTKIHTTMNDLMFAFGVGGGDDTTV